MLLFELFEVQSIPQSKFVGDLGDILYNLNVAGLISRQASKDPALAFEMLSKRSLFPLLNTHYNYTVKRTKGDEVNRPEIVIAIIDRAKKKIVGVVFLEKFRYGKIGEVWHVASLAISPEYRGQGLAEKLEAELAVGTFGLTVKSGKRQTPGSIALWNRMALNPKVEMFNIRADRAGLAITPVEIRDGKISNYPQQKNDFLIMRPRQNG